MQEKRSYFYFLSFLEGSTVMAAELFGAKLLAPYFGTSLYVWAAALGLTLGGLMSGYFIGGVISRRVRDNERALYIILILSGVFLFLMPFTSSWVMSYTIAMNLQTGALLSLLIFMFPPLLFMGMVSPLIINLLTEDAKGAGSSAGNVYAISTLGGILMTFLLGFWIIPAYGLTEPALLIGSGLTLFPAISLLRRKNYGGLAVLLALVAFFFVPGTRLSESDEGVLYRSEGVLGQIKVMELPPVPGIDRELRALVVNNTLQTVADPRDLSFNYWPYTSYIPYFASVFPRGERALLLGMGGGTLVRRLDSLGYELDVVEIDRRIQEVAVDYFSLHPEQEVIIDDARHFVRTATDDYRLIVYDVFKGESAPEHVLTLEAIAETREILRTDGMLIINFYGYLEGKLGRVTRSIVKTLHAGEFATRVYVTPGAPDSRNTLVVAWPRKVDSPLKNNELAPEYQRLPRPSLVPMTNLDDAVVLTDERPRLDLFADAAMQWRRLYNEYLVK